MSNSNNIQIRPFSGDNLEDINELSNREEVLIGSDPVKKIIEDAGGGVTYIGIAPCGTPTSRDDWIIQRVTVVGSTTTIEWALGNAQYDHIWDDRATLAYM